MKTFIRTATLLTTIFLTNCVKKSEPTDTTPAVPVSDSASLVGTWSYQSIVYKAPDQADQNSTLSGLWQMSFKANGTYTESLEAVRLTTGTLVANKDCTRYAAGKWQLVEGTVLLTDTKMTLISGQCSDAKYTPKIGISEDSSYKVYEDTDGIRLEQKYSFDGEDGVAKEGTANIVLKKSREDNWDGRNVDPAFKGAWKLSTTYYEVRCTALPNDNGTFVQNGSLTWSIADSSYTEKRVNFSYGTNTTCTTDLSGSVEDKEKYSFKVTNSQSTDDCGKQADLPDGYLEEIDRIVVSPSGKLVKFNFFSYNDQTCTDGRSYMMLTYIYESN